MKYDAVIFDLGNTLISYYTREQWPDILADCTRHAAEHLRQRDMLRIDLAELPQRTQTERRDEGKSDKVMPLIDRLERIFKLSADDLDDSARLELCRAFMVPIFATAHLHSDALPALAELRTAKIATGILSNSPWGSPYQLWREELTRHGMGDAVDVAVFCTEVGWRKPDRRPFDFTLEKLGVSAGKCLFVGDDPRWDIAGTAAIGMDSLLISRHDEFQADHPTIKSLAELATLLA